MEWTWPFKVTEAWKNQNFTQLFANHEKNWYAFGISLMDLLSILFDVILFKKDNLTLWFWILTYVINIFQSGYGDSHL